MEIDRNEATMAEDTAIEVVLQRSGLTFIVPPGKSILQVLIDEAVDPLFDCQRGECGICQVAVLEGIPDHRDHILSEEERAGNKVMQICVSRAKTPRLVIDL
jgi:ferredoxin